MRCKTPFLVPLFLLLSAGVANAQATASSWSEWQPAMTPEGLAHSSIQYRWRQSGPCTLAGCPLAVDIRNTGNAPVHLHCSLYFDTAPSPTEGEVRPVTIDAFLKAFGDSRTGTVSAGDTTSSLVVTGTKITGVVVEGSKGKQPDSAFLCEPTFVVGLLPFANQPPRNQKIRFTAELIHLAFVFSATGLP